MRQIKTFPFLTLLPFLLLGVNLNAQSPGGVTSDLKLWLKADEGVSSSGDGTDITLWTDISGDGGDLTPGTNAPNFVSTSGHANFNPYVDFDRSPGDRLNGKDYNITNRTGFNYQIFFVYEAMDHAPFTYPDLWDWDGISANDRIEHYQSNFNNTLAGPNNLMSVPENEWNISVASLTYGSPNSSATTRVNGVSAPTSPVSGSASFFGDHSISIGTNGELNANIAEIVYYTIENTGTTLQQIETYLALKYGITLPNNYLASDGTTIVFDPSTYGNAIAGIGVDSVSSSLNQKQSRSDNSNAIVTMGLGSIEATNADNGHSFAADQSFMIWGHDGMTTSFNSTFRDLANTRMDRVWKVQETKTVGTVELNIPNTVTFPSSPLYNNYLIISDDAIFDSSDSLILLTDAGTHFEAFVDFENGQFFTFAASCIAAPGGITGNLKLWLKADEGVSSSGDGTDITVWSDISGDGGDLTPGANAPNFVSTSGHANFNPYVDFDRSPGDRLNGKNYGLTNRTGLNYQMIFVYEAIDHAPFTYPDLWDWDGVVANDRIEHYDDAFDYALAAPNNLMSISANEWNISVASLTYGSPNSFATTRVNGVNAPISSISNSNGFSGNNNISIGTAGQLNANLAEIIYYTTENTGTTLQQIETYLALKYGITLPNNYLATDGAVVYDPSSYGSNIAGIGYSVCASLNQKQSKSANSDAIVTMGLSSIEATNAANSNTFGASETYMIWGHNNDSGTAFTDTGAPSGYNILDRKWRITETKTVGNVQITIDVDNPAYDIDDFTGGSLKLIYGSDLSTGTVVSMYDDGTNNDAVSGDGIWSVSNIDFSNGDLFTFAVVGCPNQVGLTTSNSTIVASTSCLEVNNWTYYFDENDPTNAVFAIEHKPTGGNSNDFEARVTITVNPNPSTPSGINSVDDGTDEGTFVMGRYWNVDITSGTLNGAVNVRFYYDPAELAAIETAMNLFADTAGPEMFTNGPIWFKTNGVDYSPALISSTEVNSGNVTQFGELPISTEDGVSYVQMNGVTSFSGGSAAYRVSSSTMTPTLPVDLLSFDVNEKQCIKQIKWTTANEDNFSHFELERSVDGIHFEKIKYIDSNQLNTRKAYQYSDKFKSEKTYYRLKMVDFDKSFEYSKIIFIKSECHIENNDILLFPNPAKGYENVLNIQFFSSRTDAKVSIIDATGQVIRTLQVDINEGWNHHKLDISDLSLGSYFLEYKTTNSYKVKKFIRL